MMSRLGRLFGDRTSFNAIVTSEILLCRDARNIDLAGDLYR